MPSKSRATATVSRPKNSGPSNLPPPPATASRGPQWNPAAASARRTLRLAADLLSLSVPAPLVNVEGLVGCLVHRLPIHARPPGDHPDAELNRDGRLGKAVELFKRRTNARAHLVGVALVSVGHGDPELVAAEPSTGVGCAHGSLQLMRQHTNRLVADVMAERVVDLFQVVEVDHHQRQAALVALRGCDRSVDRALELGPVSEPGEIVGPRLV